MFLFLALIICVFLLYAFSQFGSRLLARHALIWWLMAVVVLGQLLFFLLQKQTPSEFSETIHLFLGVCVLFLLYHIFQHNTEVARLHHGFRELITNDVSRSFSLGEGRSAFPGQEVSVKALIVLPCLNEEASLKGIISRVQALASPSGLFLDHCFINDGSRDGSEEILKRFSPGNSVSHPVNLGVSGVLLTGFKIAERGGFDYVIQCDSDGQHPIESVPRLVQLAWQGHYDLLVGSRFSKTYDPQLFSSPLEKGAEAISIFRKMGSRFIRGVLFFFGKNKTLVTDPTSGLRVYSKKAYQFLLRQMPDEYPEPESIALLSAASMNVGEVRVLMQARAHGTSSLKGLKPVQYMVKVLSALMGLRLRLTFKNLLNNET